ncbi:MAG: CopG family transcriptional regulator [Gammaproteobacteria bacterium]|nr:CopG family transcriptional regulator [Gammaproteobacteria bacterium]
MRNVTVALDDTVADWARVWAARHHTSVSRMLGELLAEKMAHEERYMVAMEEFLAVTPVKLPKTKIADRPYPQRDALHER